MSFVALEFLEQLDLQALHRAQERLVQNRTRLLNQSHGFLMERGIRSGTGRDVFQRELRRRLDDGSSFSKARDLSAWPGRVPRQITTGGKARLIRISKHGNSYQRKLFIHGIRTALHLVHDCSTPLAIWVDALKQRDHAYVAGVAIANKLAPIVWAVLIKGERYRPSPLEAA